MRSSHFIPAFAIAALMAGCELSAPRSLSTEPSLPLKRKLTDVSGRQLEAEIVARNASSISIVRLRDGQAFELPISRLSEKDRRFVEGLPITASPGQPDAGSNSGGRRDGSVFVRDRLDEKTKEYEGILHTLNYERIGTMRHRSLVRQAGRLQQEVDALRLELAEWDRRP